MKLKLSKVWKAVGTFALATALSLGMVSSVFAANQLADAQYYAPVKLLKVDKASVSMGNKALDPTGQIVVKDGKSSLVVDFHKIKFSGIEDGLTGIEVYDQNATVDKGNIVGNLINTSVSKASDGFINQVVIPLNSSQLNAGTLYIPVRVTVNAMEELLAGARPSAYIQVAVPQLKLAETTSTTATAVDNKKPAVDDKKPETTEKQPATIDNTKDDNKQADNNQNKEIVNKEEKSDVKADNTVNKDEKVTTNTQTKNTTAVVKTEKKESKTPKTGDKAPLEVLAIISILGLGASMAVRKAYNKVK